MMYNVFKMAQSAKSTAAQRSLGVDSESDVAYLKKIIKESDHPKKEELMKKIDAQYEERKNKDASKKPSGNLADLLGDLEGEFDGLDDLALLKNTKEADQQIDMMKQLSESFAQDAKNAELSLKTGDSVDRHMNMDAVTETMNHLEHRKSVELTKAPSVEEKAKIEELYGKERYKAMKDLDRQNERASPK